MKKYLLLFILFFVVMPGACTGQVKKIDPTQKQTLKLTLHFNKQEFRIDEEVVAYVGLENISNRTILVNSRMAMNLPFVSSPIREIAFIVLTPSGNEYWPGTHYTPRGIGVNDFVELKPGDHIERIYYLTNLSYKFSEIGIYSVMTNYQNFVDPNSIDLDDNRIAWKGELNSNEVQLTITP